MDGSEGDIVEDGFGWTDAQRRVIAHRDGPIQVTACAGSGKTLTVSRRIAEMVHNGVDRNSVVAFTFTENAAEELKVKIRRQMETVNPENPILGSMFVGTIHSFCLELLHQFDPDTLNYDVLDENKLAAFLSQHYRHIGLHELEPRHPEAKFKKIQWFVEDINTMRRERIEESVRSSDNPSTQRFIEVYNRFRELMRQYHFLDYEEIIYRTVRLLEGNPDKLRMVREKYKYIVVDEYQDVDASQERLIGLLVGENRNLCVVGDDDQSIYKWRGARTENFLEFEDRYVAAVERLEMNFRSTDLIVGTADSVISCNRRRLPKTMESTVRFDLGDVYQVYFDQEDDEVRFVCDKIEQLVGTVFSDGRRNEKNLTYGDIAILLRRKKDMEPLITELENREILFTVRGQETIFGRPESALVRLAFAYIARGQYPDLQIIDTTKTRYPQKIARCTVDEDALRAEIRRSHLLREREDRILEGLREKRGWYENPTSRRIQPQKEFQDILSYMGIREIGEAGEGFPEPVMYELGRISALLKDFETVYELIFPDQIGNLVEFLDWAYYHANTKIEDPTLVDAVNIMTIHAAKGTEYPVVFMPSQTSVKFSHRMPRTYARPLQYEWIPPSIFNYELYQENEEDSRRLFYVAMTRSRKYLFLTGAENNRGYKNRQKPSVHFTEVKNLRNPGIVTELLDDPTPRDRREVAGGGDEYVYPTSFTDLRYFHKCPYDYKLRKIYGFSPPIDSAFGYGFAVHDILREMHQRFQEGSTSILPSPGEVSAMVRDPDRFYLRYARGTVADNLRREAERILTDYVTEYRQDITLTYRAEVPFEYLIEDETTRGAALVSGAIDLLQRIDPDTKEVREVNVIDFKTEHEPDSEFDPRIRDSKFQVRLYALATRSEFDLATVEGYIHYLSEGERKKVDLDDSKLEQVKISVKQNVQRIVARRFFPTPEGEKCRRCDFRRVCGHSAG